MKKLKKTSKSKKTKRNKLSKKTIIIIISITIVLLVVLYLLFGFNAKLDKQITSEVWVAGTHYIELTEDGLFDYYCDCGNSIEHYDECPTYKYNPITKIISLECRESEDKIIDKIKIVKSTDKELVLKFGKENRTFYTEQYREQLLSEEGPDFKDLEFYNEEKDIVMEFKSDRTFIAYNKTTKGKVLNSDICPTYEFKYHVYEEHELYLICNDGTRKKLDIRGGGKNKERYRLILSFDYYGKELENKEFEINDNYTTLEFIVKLENTTKE